MDDFDNIEITDGELNRILIFNIGHLYFLKERGPHRRYRVFQSYSYVLPEDVEEYNQMFINRQYEEAYEKMDKFRMIDTKSKWYYDYCLIVLAYFKMDKPEEAKRLIESQNHITLWLPAVILSIAEKVGATYIPKIEHYYNN